MAKEERMKYNYQYDSVARAYVQPVEPVRIPVPSEPKRKHKVAPRPKVDIAFGVQMTLCGVALFSAAIMYVHSYSSLRSKQSELNALKKEKITLANQITTIEAQMIKKMDLDKIKEKAINELGMQKPLAYQIVYIDMPEQSYTTYND